MITKYRIGGPFADIETIDNIVRESATCIWRKNYTDDGVRRELKVSKYGRYFDTFEQARDFVHAHLKGKVTSARYALQNAKDELAEFEKQHALRSETPV